MASGAAVAVIGLLVPLAVKLLRLLVPAIVLGLLRPATYAALVAAGLLSVLLFPPVALRLLSRDSARGGTGQGLGLGVPSHARVAADEVAGRAQGVRVVVTEHASTGPERHLEPDDRLGQTSGVFEGMRESVGEPQRFGVVGSEGPAARCEIGVQAGKVGTPRPGVVGPRVRCRHGSVRPADAGSPR